MVIVKYCRKNGNFACRFVWWLLSFLNNLSYPAFQQHRLPIESLPNQSISDIFAIFQCASRAHELQSSTECTVAVTRACPDLYMAAASSFSSLSYFYPSSIYPAALAFFVTQQEGVLVVGNCIPYFCTLVLKIVTFYQPSIHPKNSRARKIRLMKLLEFLLNSLSREHSETSFYDDLYHMMFHRKYFECRRNGHWLIHILTTMHKQIYLTGKIFNSNH